MTQAAEQQVREVARQEQERELRVRTILANNLEFYCKHLLKIRTKDASVEPLLFNEYQKKLDEVAKRQMAERGYVRIIVPKARQGGVSTYVQARAYHKVTHTRGMRAMILTHSDAATGNIFAMAKRFNDHMEPDLRPVVGASNANELLFSNLDSGYKVATAKATGVGRSDTIQFFHGSEVAYWANAKDHAAGALQAVPMGPGTEVWLESTANGMGGYFYDAVQAAMRGESEYELVFLPWFMLSEYRREPPQWKVPAKWQEYGDAHGIDKAQLYWAYLKSAELAIADKLTTDEPCPRFRQEYPATVEEAFQAAIGAKSFISSELVLKARKATPYRDDTMPVKIGVDVGRGGDPSHIVDRRGRRSGELCDLELKTNNLMDVVAEVAQVIIRTNAVQCAIDITGGWGSGVYDRLGERRLSCELVPVDYGSGARNKQRYANKRAEIYGEMRDWLDDPGGASIPDDEQWQVELCAAGHRRNSNEQIVLEPKEDIKARLGFSPNRADALANTFAEPVADYSGRGGLPQGHVDEGDDCVEDEFIW